LQQQLASFQANVDRISQCLRSRRLTELQIHHQRQAVGATHHHHHLLLPMTLGDGNARTMYALSHDHGHPSRK
jgi:hypothetical protein